MTRMGRPARPVPWHKAIAYAMQLPHAAINRSVPRDKASQSPLRRIIPQSSQCYEKVSTCFMLRITGIRSSTKMMQLDQSSMLYLKRKINAYRLWAVVSFYPVATAAKGYHQSGDQTGTGCSRFLHLQSRGLTVLQSFILFYQLMK